MYTRHGPPTVGPAFIEPLEPRIQLSDVGSVPLNTPTALHATTSSFAFDAGDWDRDGAPDLMVVSKQGGGGTTEVHVLKGGSAYREFSLHQATVLHRTDDSWDFEFADFDADGVPDLFAINRAGPAAADVHVLSGASRFQRFLFQRTTAFPRTDPSVEFDVFDYNRDGRPDILAVVRNGASGRTEAHVLDGASQYQTYLLQIPTALHTSGSEFAFETGDADNDGTPDLYAVKRRGGAGSTEMHILDGANRFATFQRQSPTVLPETGDGWEFKVSDFSRDGVGDVVALNRSGLSGSTEYSVLDGRFNGTVVAQKTRTKLTVHYAAVTPGRSARLRATLVRDLPIHSGVGNVLVTFSVVGYGKVCVGITDFLGNVSVSFSPGEALRAGQYRVVAAFEGYGKDLRTTGSGRLGVIPASPAIVVAPVSGRIGQKVTVSATLQDRSTGDKIADRRLEFLIDGRTYGAITDENGVAKVSFTIRRAGGYAVVVQFTKGKYDGYFLDSRGYGYIHSIR